ncbi:MAG: DUF935 family protein [Desulfurellales bacterium]|nr:MAG: DUF935 family protein [Desulfurellales bacterium]
MASPKSGFVRSAAARALTGLFGFAGLSAPQVEAANLKPAPPIETVPVTTPAAPGFGPRYTTAHDQTAYVELSRAYEALFGRISNRLGPTNPRWNTFSGDLKPETILDAIQTANAGIPFVLCDMYRRAVEQDAHLSGLVLKTFSDIVVTPDRIEPPESLKGDPLAENIAIWQRAAREQIENFDEARFGLLWAEGQSYAAAENIYDFRRIRWRTKDGRSISREYLVPIRLEIVEGRSFRFDMETDDPLLWIEGDYLTLPPGKFVFHVANGVTQIKERRGFMRSCLFLHAIKQWTIRDCAEFLHIYGIPQMILEYSPKSYEYPAAQELSRKLREWMGQGGIPAVPAEQVRLRNDTPPPDGALVHTQAGDWLNTEMTKAVTASGPLTMESGGGNYGLGDVHASGGYNPQLLRARGLYKSIRWGTYWPTLQLNKYRLAGDLGETPDDILASFSGYSPQIEREQDPEKRQKTFSQAMKDGCTVSLAQYRNVLQLDAPKDKDDELRGEGQPIPSSGAIVSAVDASDGAEAPIPGKTAPSVGVTNPERPSDRDETPKSSGGVDLTATAQAAVITVDEAREKMGLGPWKDSAEGSLTVTEFIAKHSGVIAKSADAESGDASQEKDS